MKKKHTQKIDWKTLTKDELKTLSDQLEKEATQFDEKLSRYLANTKEDKSEEVKKKLDMLWSIANSMWSKVRAIENWRMKHG